jgi:DNA-binding transcriptional ArsR family regulator
LFSHLSSRAVPAPRCSVEAGPAGGGGRPPAGGCFETECAAFFSEVVQVFGVPKSVGQIYGLLFASPEPLSFSDIVERLDISKGSASQGLQLLRSLGAINVAVAKQPERNAKGATGADKAKQQQGSSSTPGGPLRLAPDALRREYFEPEMSLRRLVGGVMQERISPLAAASTNRLERLRELAKSDEVAGDFYLTRVKQLEVWRRRLRTVLPVLTMMLGPKSSK